MKINGRVDIFIDKSGYPVAVLKSWDKETKKVESVKYFDLDNKTDVLLVSGHSYTANIEGYLNLRKVETKSKTFVSVYMTAYKIEILNDFKKESAYQDDEEEVPHEPTENEKKDLFRDADELPF